MSSRDAGSFRQPGGNGGASSAAAPHHNNNNNGVKFAGEESKDKMYEPKHTKKLVRVLTVVAYIFSVSLAAIMLSVYYVFLWQPRDQHALHARVHGSSAAVTGQTTDPANNRSVVTPALASPEPPSPAPVACECPPSQPAASETHNDAPSPPPPSQHHHQEHHEQQQPMAVSPLPAPASDENSASQLNKEQVSTTQTPEGDIAESIEGHMKSKQQVTDIPRASREGQRLPFRSFQNALQV